MNTLQLLDIDIVYNVVVEGSLHLQIKRLANGSGKTEKIDKAFHLNVRWESAAFYCVIEHIKRFYSLKMD